MKRIFKHTAIAALLAAAIGAAQAGTVTVVTSFPKELTQAYKTAFEKAHRDPHRDPQQEHGAGHGLCP